MKETYALGVGHNTPVLIELAEACGYKVIGLYHYNDSRTGEYDHGFEILGSFDDLFCKDSLCDMNFLLTMGDSKIRAGLSEKILKKGGNVPTIIHPTAVISRFAKVSDVGVYIFPYVIVETDVILNQNITLLTGSIISHNSSIGKNCFIAAGVIVGAYTDIDEYVFVGQGALTISGKVAKIGKNAFIAARALVTKDVPENVLVKGNPAKAIIDNMVK